MPTNKQRREAARRKLERQLEARDERARRRRQGNMIASVIGGIVVVAVVIGIVVFTNGHKSKTTAATTPAATSAAATSAASSAAATTSAAPKEPAYPCTWTKSGTSAVAGIKVPATTKPSKVGTVKIAVKSTQGDLTFTLNRAEAPCAVESFVSLVQQKYFNNSPCHRLVTTGIFVLQCGDPTGKGTGGPGYSINDEYTGKETFPAGEIAMANTGSPDTGGSQFFIMTKDSSAGFKGNAAYTVFGTVTAGMPVVDKVAAAGSNNANATGDGAPKLAIKFTSMTVAK